MDNNIENDKTAEESEVCVTTYATIYTLLIYTSRYPRDAI